jgi:hypothetical protein
MSPVANDPIDYEVPHPGRFFAAFPPTGSGTVKRRQFAGVPGLKPSAM